MLHALLFIATAAALFALVPLSTWAATGRLRDAWHAAKGYALCLGIMVGLGFAWALLELGMRFLAA